MQTPNYLSSPWKTFLFAIRPYRFKFVVILICIIIGNICGDSVPYFLKSIVDTVTNHSGPISMSELLTPFFLLAGVLVFQELFFRTGHLIETYFSPEVFKHITTSLYAGLIRRPPSYFENRFSGDLGRRIEQIATSVMAFVDSPWEFGWMLLAVIMAGVILSFTHVYVLYTFIGWTIIFAGTSIPLLVWHKKASAKLAESHAVLSGSVIDTLTNIPLVHSFGGVPYEEVHNDQMTMLVVAAERKARLISVLEKFQCGMSIALLGISLAYVSVLLFSKGEFTVGDFTLVVATIPSLSGVIWSFGEIVLRVTRRYGEMSDAVASLREDQRQLSGGIVKDTVNEQYSIGFKDLSFAYPGTTVSVFDRFSLQFKQGERVGIVGSSGAGKSTLVKLLLRQHQPNEGSIMIGEVPIQEFDLTVFHNLISYVPQDTSLFHRSLLDNIRYARLDAPDTEVIAASKQANADDFIRTFPLGYETKVGERGVKLSGGQRQRIALARAILKNAPILVLDEATSSLDTESESSIQEALTKLFADRTVIAIAHRLSTLRAMDRIVVVENGNVVEDGTPQTLLNKENGIFKRMWEKQKDGFIS